MRLEAAEAELARRDAQEPIYQLMDDGKWYDTEKYLYDEAKARGDEAQVVYAEPRPAVLQVWTDAQCLEFISVAFRHAEISGDFEMDDIRLGMKMVNAGGEIAE